VRRVDVCLGRQHRLDRLLFFIRLEYAQVHTDLVIALRTQEISLYKIDEIALIQNHSENSLNICKLLSSRNQSWRTGRHVTQRRRSEY
jgi:hypothetical protein